MNSITPLKIRQEFAESIIKKHKKHLKRLIFKYAQEIKKALNDKETDILSYCDLLNNDDFNEYLIKHLADTYEAFEFTQGDKDAK